MELINIIRHEDLANCYDSYLLDLVSGRYSYKPSLPLTFNHCGLPPADEEKILDGILKNNELRSALEYAQKFLPGRQAEIAQQILAQPDFALSVASFPKERKSFERGELDSVSHHKILERWAVYFGAGSSIPKEFLADKTDIFLYLHNILKRKIKHVWRFNSVDVPYLVGNDFDRCCDYRGVASTSQLVRIYRSITAARERKQNISHFNSYVQHTARYSWEGFTRTHDRRLAQDFLFWGHPIYHAKEMLQCASHVGDTGRMDLYQSILNLPFYKTGLAMPEEKPEEKEGH